MDELGEIRSLWKVLSVTRSDGDGGRGAAELRKKMNSGVGKFSGFFDENFTVIIFFLNSDDFFFE